jgi:predicted phosphohydrolase
LDRSPPLEHLSLVGGELTATLILEHIEEDKIFLNNLEGNKIRIENHHYFYTRLFLARLVSLIKKDKFTGNEIEWKYSEKNIITIAVKKILDIDFLDK